MITGLPAYKPPIAQPVRCYCRSLYFVFTGELDSQAEKAQQTAQQMGARFVDARLTPFYQSECGQMLDFAPEHSMLIQ
jgi:hypothetical protein